MSILEKKQGPIKKDIVLALAYSRWGLSPNYHQRWPV